jgi:hypothetical protein
MLNGHRVGGRIYHYRLYRLVLPGYLPGCRLWRVNRHVSYRANNNNDLGRSSGWALSMGLTHSCVTCHTTAERLAAVPFGGSPAGPDQASTGPPLSSAPAGTRASACHRLFARPRSATHDVTSEYTTVGTPYGLIHPLRRFRSGFRCFTRRYKHCIPVPTAQKPRFDTFQRKLTRDNRSKRSRYLTTAGAVYAVTPGREPGTGNNETQFRSSK